MSERPVYSNVLPSGSHGVCASSLHNLAEFAISDADKDHFCLIWIIFPPIQVVIGVPSSEWTLKDVY